LYRGLKVDTVAVAVKGMAVVREAEAAEKAAVGVVVKGAVARAAAEVAERARNPIRN